MTQEASPNQQYINLSMFRVSVPRRANYIVIESINWKMSSCQPRPWPVNSCQPAIEAPGQEKASLLSGPPLAFYC